MIPRILYIGNLRPGGNGIDRVLLLKDNGFSVEGIDTLPYRQGGPRLIRSLTARYQVGPYVRRLNQHLASRATIGGYDGVLVDKGTLIYRKTLQLLKEGSEGKVAVHFTPDAAFFDNRAQHFVQSVPDYDLLVTTKSFELSAYRSAGAREIMLIEQGYGPRIDPRLRHDVPQHLRSEVVFVGHCQPHYIRLLKVAAATAPLSIWGPGWPEQVKRHSWLREVVRGPGLFGPDYAKALAGAKIAIGLLSKRIPETTTTRSFEIPAMGTMLLAERTEDHQRLFKEDEEAVFFDSPRELAEKLTRYLADDATRAEIARAGYEKSRTAGYDLAHQFAPAITWMRRALFLSPRSKGYSL